jgi:hypothetical protein
MRRDRRRPNFFCAVGVFTGARLRLQVDGDRFHILQNLREAVQAELSRDVGSSVRALSPASNGDEEREAAIAAAHGIDTAIPSIRASPGAAIGRHSPP